VVMSVQQFIESYPDWQQLAACKGQCAPVFFPPLHFEGKQARLSRERRAKAICAGCDVRAECLDFAMKTGEPHGVWGGLNEAERRTQLGDDLPGFMVGQVAVDLRSANRLVGE
jgi:WhiB family transcriptional regulator, redox-sensing transcriptional regulator